MQNKKRILGKGLSALISDNSFLSHENSISTDNSIAYEILLEEIVPNPWQPRKIFEEVELIELKNSILEHGIIQPISVRRKDNQYQIIAGERRWQASKLAGKSKIPAIVIAYNDKQMLEAALVENIQRQNLNPIDEARAFKAMMEEYNYTQIQISKKVGKSRSYIANSVRLLSLPEDVQIKLINRKLSASHARTLIGRKDASEGASEIIINNLNVRTAEKINRSTKDSNKNQSDLIKSEDIISIEKSLIDSLNMNVEIQTDNESGTMVINFANFEELDIIVQRLMNVNQMLNS